MSEAGQTRGSSTPAPGAGQSAGGRESPGSHEVDGRRDTTRLEAFSEDAARSPGLQAEG